MDQAYANNLFKVIQRKKAEAADLEQKYNACKSQLWSYNKNVLEPAFKNLETLFQQTGYVVEYQEEPSTETVIGHQFLVLNNQNKVGFQYGLAAKIENYAVKIFFLTFKFDIQHPTKIAEETFNPFPQGTDYSSISQEMIFNHVTDLLGKSPAFFVC